MRSVFSFFPTPFTFMSDFLGKANIRISLRQGTGSQVWEDQMLQES